MPSFLERTLIEKGWSGDKKYRAVLPDGSVVLYRVTPADSYERKAREFEYLQSAASLGIPMCMPLEFASDCEEANEDSIRFHLHAGFTEANRIVCFVKKRTTE